MKKIIATLLIFLTPMLAFGATTTFLEAGTDATQGTQFWVSPTVRTTSSSAQSHTGSRSLQFDVGNPQSSQSTNTANGILSDNGSQISFWFRMNGLPGVNAAMVQLRTTTPTTRWTFNVNTDGTTSNVPTGATSQTGTKVLSINTWYRICISYYATGTTQGNWQFKVYIDGVLDSTTNTGTLTGNSMSQVRFIGQDNFGVDKIIWIDDVYVATGDASSTSQPDTGDIRVTAKRPFANGTTNGFTGSGTPSSYGTGNARYVNEQPLSTSNFVSVLGAGSAVTEQYNIEAREAGDVNLFGKTIIDSMGWIYAKVAAATDSGQITVNGVDTGITLTTTDTIFTAARGSTSYASGTGSDIGMKTGTAVTTETLEEAGVLYAFKFPDFNPWHFWYF